MELKKIIKNTSYLVFSKSIQFVLGLVRSKLAALYIGTSGVGIYSQVSYLTTMISQLTLVSMNDGLVKQIAENKNNEAFKKILIGLLKAYSILITIACILSLTICLFFSKELTKFFLGDYKFQVYFLFGLSCVPILIINSLSYAVLKSHKSTKLIAQTNILSSILGLAVYVPLIYFFRVTGAVISISASYLLALYMNNYYARVHILKEYNIKLRHIFYARIEKQRAKELLYFAFFGATTGMYMMFVESGCRSIVINQLGIDKVGIYSPITSWSGLLTGFICPSLNIYLYPRYSECKSNEEITGIFNDYLRLISFIMIPFLFLAIPFKNIIIPFFYSKDFLEAGVYLPWHFIGILFFMWMYPMGVLFTPTGNIKIYSILLIILSTIDLGIVFFLVPIIGLYGWMLKFIITPVLFSFIYFLFFRKKIQLQINKSNVILMVYVFGISLMLTLLDSFNIKYLLSFVFVLTSIFFLEKKEKNYLINKVRLLMRC